MRAFVVEAEVVLTPECDPRSLGATVTTELCGHWEHEGACRWPHNSAIDVDDEPARFRTVFVADDREEADVRHRIETGLRRSTSWRVVEVRSRPVAESERRLAERLPAGPRSRSGGP